MNFVSSKLHSMGEFMTPVLKNSKFKDTGVITAKEVSAPRGPSARTRAPPSNARCLPQFETAGDFLAWKCPTWSWDSGEESKRRSYLSPDKQFLVTRNGKQPGPRRTQRALVRACDALRLLVGDGRIAQCRAVHA